MYESILAGLSTFTLGPVTLFTSGLPNLVMLVIGGVLIYLGVKKDVEPLLLVPIGFGCILANIPLSDLMEKEGFLRVIYDMGIAN
jgi:carboxybiotin decarboxylase